MKRHPWTYDHLSELARKNAVVDASRHYQLLMMDAVEKLRAYSETEADYVTRLREDPDADTAVY